MRNQRSSIMFLLCLLSLGSTSTHLLSSAARLEAFFSTHFPDEALTSMMPFYGGGSYDELFLCTTSKKEYVAKLFKADSPYVAFEIPAHVAAAKSGLAPKLYAYADDIMAMEYINARTLVCKQANDPGFLSTFVEAVRSTETLDHAVPARNKYPFAEIEGHFAALNPAMPLYETITEGLTIVRELQKQLDASGRSFVFCHGDIHPRNIFFTDGKVVFIDWSDGGMCYPWYDFATLSCLGCLSEENDLFLLRSYLRAEPSPEDLIYFQQLKCVFLYLDIVRMSHYLQGVTPSSDEATAVTFDFNTLASEWATDVTGDTPESLQALTYAELRFFMRSVAAFRAAA